MPWGEVKAGNWRLGHHSVDSQLIVVRAAPRTRPAAVISLVAARIVSSATSALPRWPDPDRGQDQGKTGVGHPSEHRLNGHACVDPIDALQRDRHAPERLVQAPRTGSPAMSGIPGGRASYPSAGVMSSRNGAARPAWARDRSWTLTSSAPSKLNGLARNSHAAVIEPHAVRCETDGGGGHSNHGYFDIQGSQRRSSRRRPHPSARLWRFSGSARGYRGRGDSCAADRLPAHRHRRCVRKRGGRGSGHSSRGVGPRRGLYHHQVL